MAATSPVFRLLEFHFLLCGMVLLVVVVLQARVVDLPSLWLHTCISDVGESKSSG